MNIGLLIVRRALEHNVFITVFGRVQENKAASRARQLHQFQKKFESMEKNSFEVQKMFSPDSTFYTEMPSNESKMCK